MDIEPTHTGWITTNMPLLLPEDEIESVEKKSVKIDSELNGAMLVRVNLKRNYILLICEDEEEWENAYNDLNKSSKIPKLRGR